MSRTDTEILNLDELLPEQPRYIEIKGRQFTVPESSLEQDLKIRRLINKLKQSDSEASGAEKDENLFEVMTEIIKISVPDMPGEVLDAMSMPRLSAVFRFVQGATLDELKTELAQVSEEVARAVSAAEPAKEGDEKN